MLWLQRETAACGLATASLRTAKHLGDGGSAVVKAESHNRISLGIGLRACNALLGH